MDTTRPQVLTEAQQAGRMTAIFRMLLIQVVGIVLLVWGLLLWGIHKGAPAPPLSVPVGLMLLAGYALPAYGVYQFTKTLRALGIRSRRRA
jgi:hypothetical protein